MIPIKEEIIPISKNRDFVMQCIPTITLHECNAHEYMYAVYTIVDGQKVPIIAFCLKHIAHEEKYAKKQMFAKWLRKVHPKTFEECLFFVDVYRQFMRQHDFELADIFKGKQKFTKVAVVDAILRDSRGYILWHYQLENIIRLFYNDICRIKDFYELLHMSDVIAGFRRGINDRKMIFVELTDKFVLQQKLLKKVTLYSVISERMLLGPTIEPNIQGARHVFAK